MKTFPIRMPDELVGRLREEAARETIKRGERFSMNTLAVEILTNYLKKRRKDKM